MASLKEGWRRKRKDSGGEGGVEAGVGNAIRGTWREKIEKNTSLYRALVLSRVTWYSRC